MVERLLKCAIPSWYDGFRELTIETHCIPIPENVFNYFKNDSVTLPSECYTFDLDDCLDDDPEVPHFPEFSKIIKDTLESLNYSAFVKTNWHSPQDATWITCGQTLKSSSITDIYQLLKASNIVAHDFDLPGIDSSMHYIALKKFVDIHPGTEFRCFVKNNKLIAISPRDWPQYYEHIAEAPRSISKTIIQMFTSSIKNTFPLNDYVFDVVISPERNYILDFALLDKDWTKTLAFDWEFFDRFALPDDGVYVETYIEAPEFRYVSCRLGVQATQRTLYGWPLEATFTEEDYSSTINELLYNVIRFAGNPEE